VSAAEFIFQHAFQRTGGGSTAIFEIRCLEGYCDSLERTDFVYYSYTVNRRSLDPMRITSVVLIDFDGVIVDPPQVFPTEPSKNKDGNGKKTVTIVAVVLGVILLVVVVAVAFYCYIAHRRRFSRTSPEIVDAPVDGQVVRGVVLPAPETEMSTEQPSSTGKAVSYPPSATSSSA